MTNLFISAAFVAIAFTACNNGSNKSTEGKSSNKDSSTTAANPEQVYSCSMHPEVRGKMGDRCPKCNMELTVLTTGSVQNETQTKVSTDTKATIAYKEIIDSYLRLKNALTNDNSKDAAKAGVTLEAALKNLDKSLLTPEEKKVYEDVAEDARMHAQHIRENAGNIGHQREHFDMLSKDMYDLVKAFGSSQVLYKDFCPMYNDKKGAFWLSETKEIKNPYYGKSMLTCGSVKEEIK